MNRASGLLVAALLCLPSCKKDRNQGAEAAENAGAAEASGDRAAAAPEPAAEPAGADAELLARGEYIAALAGCEQCHTPFGPHGPDFSRAWAGGLEVKEVFGTWRSPNITQDEKTGIGAWTDEQIDTAVRQGVRPDGSRMVPLMPYPFYNAISDDDMKALIAYLRTVEPIEHEVARSEVSIPPVEVPPPSGKPVPTDDPVAYGGYLAGLMHCASCHSPLTEKGPDLSRAFAGGMPLELPELGEGTLYTSNLTPHETGIADYSDEDLINAVRGMKKRDGSVIQGPMALYQKGWFQMKDEDVRALVAFLRSLPPIDNAVPKSTFVAKTPPK